MKLRIPPRKAGWAAVEIAAILLLHLVLIRVLAGTDVVATILSAGPHAPLGHLLVAGGFALVRMLAVLLLPGIILNRVVLLAFHNWTQAEPPDPDPPAPREGSSHHEPGSSDEAQGGA